MINLPDKHLIMIQRIQSVFLLVAAIALAALFKYPVAESSASGTPFFDDQLFSISDHPILLGLTAIAALGCLISIFFYKNRVLQIRIATISMIATLFLGIVAIWLIYSNASSWAETMSINDGIGLYLNILAFVMIILANVFIKKDENTVRSMDRLR